MSDGKMESEEKAFVSCAIAVCVTIMFALSTVRGCMVDFERSSDEQEIKRLEHEQKMYENGFELRDGEWRKSNDGFTVSVPV